jgi:hypothetical protein
MVKRAAVVVVAVALAVVGGGTAVSGAAKAKKKHNCKVDVTAVVGTVRVDSGNPPANGSETSAGIVDGKVCGKAFHGAVRGVSTFTAPGVFNLTTVSLGPLGSTTATGSGAGTLNADGSASFSRTAKIVSGTGITKGATGSYTFTGTQPKGSSVSTQHVTGTIKY